MTTQRAWLMWVKPLFTYLEHAQTLPTLEGALRP